MPRRNPLERVLGSELGAMYGRDATRSTASSFVSGTHRHGLRWALACDRRAHGRWSDRAGRPGRRRDRRGTASGARTRGGDRRRQRRSWSTSASRRRSRDLRRGRRRRADHPGYGRRLRIEHWDNAKRQGRVAAANMLGRRRPTRASRTSIRPVRPRDGVHRAARPTTGSSSAATARTASSSRSGCAPTASSPA